MKAKILIVEDEKDVRDLMLLHLKREEHDPLAVEDGEKALEIIKNQKFDLYILDWMLPGLSGLELCKHIHQARNTEHIPVLMVTARADSNDIIRGLESGADDYVTKPFELPIFLARVKALLRRNVLAFKSSSDESIYKLGNLSVDKKAYKAMCANQELQLTVSEFKLLCALLENQGKVLSREKLITLVQGTGVMVIQRAIDTHIFGLRKKLGNCSEFIETIRGVGYRVKDSC